VGNFRHLYIAVVNETGAIITTLKTQTPNGLYSPYVPTGELEADLRESLYAVEAVSGRRIYNTKFGRVYTIFWPVTDEDNTAIAVVGMEFDLDNTYQSLKDMALYCLILSAILVAVMSVIAFLSMSKASEPFYQRLTDSDFLTGLKNRLAFERKLMSYEDFIMETGAKVTLVMLDIIELYRINCSWGHKAGDICIINTGKIITELTGDLGEVYRIGGDDFAILIVDREKHEVDRLTIALHREKRKVFKIFPFDCAIGRAVFRNGQGDTMNEMTKRAEADMREDRNKQLLNRDRY
jgi:diguanylate cyclase (GGDEF)-like protein